MKKIKLTNVKVDVLKPYFDEIDIKSDQTILFTKNSIAAKAYPMSKNFIKYKEIDTTDVFEGGDAIGEDTLMLPLNSLDNLEKVLKFYSDGDITITLFVDGEYIAKMEFDNGIHKFTAKSSDVDQVAPPLKEEIWSTFKNTDGSYLSVSIPKERITQIIKLHDICGSKNQSVVITRTEKDGLIVTNSHESLTDADDKWSYSIPDDSINSNEFPMGTARIFNISTLGLIKDEELTLYIKDNANLEGKSVMIFKGDDKSIVICVSAID